MRLLLEQLSEHVTKKLAPIYLISGDETLLIQEARDTIINAATLTGYTEKRLFDSSEAQSWGHFIQTIQSRSLFSEKILLEYRCSATKLTETGHAALKKFAAQPPTDKLLIVILPKLTPAQQNAAWFQACEKSGVFVAIWPVSPKQFPRWFKRRLAAKGFTIDQQTLQLISDYTEGNLLAAQQCIEKLSLLFAPGYVSTEQVMDSLMDASRYTVFDLVNAVWQKQLKKIVHILHHLHTEDVEPAIILWALARECRKYQCTDTLPALLHVDQCIKGQHTDNVWQILQQVCFAIAGKPLFSIGTVQ